jgi:hypothetical protein
VRVASQRDEEVDDPLDFIMRSSAGEIQFDVTFTTSFLFVQLRHSIDASLHVSSHMDSEWRHSTLFWQLIYLQSRHFNFCHKFYDTKLTINITS